MIEMNPECRDGKCKNCDGVGWNLEKDEPGDCPCQCHVRMTRSDAKDVLRGFHYGGGPIYPLGKHGLDSRGEGERE
jgi:hypothetical protein